MFVFVVQGPALAFVESASLVFAASDGGGAYQPLNRGRVAESARFLNCKGLSSRRASSNHNKSWPSLTEIAQACVGTAPRRFKTAGIHKLAC